jgi:hypothetical protein
MGRSGKKKLKNARKRLLLVWLGFFVLNLTVVLFYLLAQWIEMDSFKMAIKQLSASYAPYLGVMLLFYWGRAGKGDAVKTGLPFWLALIGSGVWNVLILVFFLFLPIEGAVDSTREIGGLLAWLVAGAIGYYFAHDSSG